MKILLLDIETAPNVAYVWGLWNENIPLARLVDSSYTLCYTAKWYGHKELMYDSVQRSNPKRMVKGIYNLLNEADAVVHYNGNKFDIPVLNKEFVLQGLPPPAPAKQIDLYKVVKQRFRFPSNKLEYVVKALGVGVKHSPSFDFWVRCMEGEEEAWAVMEKYNKEDVILLEHVYEVVKPWIKQHANHSLFVEGLVCPNCGSVEYRRRGFSYTSAAKYQRYNCKSCGNWFRGGVSIAGKPAAKFINL